MRLGLRAKFFFVMDAAQSKKKNKKKNKGVQKFESKEEYFTKNGGILLEKHIALSHGQDIGSGQLKIITEDEIKNATNNYDPSLIVASFREGIVYRGTFDDRIVAIKTPQDRYSNPKLIDLFLTEVSIAMVTLHDNMVKIYGCCLETYIPMMVYEFLPRSKNLHQCLHGDMSLHKSMKWSNRLSIATDIAYALSYMHNALLKPIVHRDVKSLGILLDTSFRGKLLNLGYLVSVTPGKSDQRWPIHGTPGYIDPEYIETKEVTDKCDVYNFGVLMLELLTGRDPVEMTKCGFDLVGMFVFEIERNGIKEMVDTNVVEEGNMDEIRRFAQLAVKCVAREGGRRPTMISVVEELWSMEHK